MGSDRTSANYVPSLEAKSNAADGADVVLWADPSTHRLLVDASVTITGLTSVDDSAFTAGTGTGVPMMGFATADSVDSGDVGVVGMTTDRALFVYIKGTDVGAAGSTSMVDDAAFTPAVTSITPMGAFFDDVAPDSVNEGDGGVVRMSANRNLYVTLRDAAGNERGLNIAADGSLAITVATIPSHAVTNAGTFVVQENGAALTALQLIDDTVATLGTTTYTEAATKGLVVGVVRRDANTSLVDTTNEMTALQVNATGELKVALIQALPTGANVIGAVTQSGTWNIGTVTTVTGVTTVSTVTAVTTVSTVSALGTGTTGPQKAENVAFANGDMGLAVWTVRQDTLATTAANGDYVPFSSDSIGALYTRDTATQVDDAAFTPATGRIMPIGFLVDDTATDSVDEGDGGIPRMSADRIIYVQGALASDAVDAGNPLKVGGQARTTNPTAVADADRVNFIADKLGKQVVVGSVRDLKTQQITTITTSTSETTVLTAVASTFLDVYGIICVNSSATATNVSFKDSTAGTTRFNIYVPAGETRGFMLNESAAVNQATVNNNWTATSSASITSLIVTVLAVKNT